MRRRSTARARAIKIITKTRTRRVKTKRKVAKKPKIIRNLRPRKKRSLK